MKKSDKKSSDKRQLKRGDILLLFLYVDNCSPLRGRTRLQKMAFIFEKELLKQYGFDKKLERTDASFDFICHNYGPFSSKILELMDFFVNIKMIEVSCDKSYENTVNIKDYEEAIDNIDDEDIFIRDLKEQSLDEEESDYCREPIYKLTKIGISYVKDQLVPYLSTEQVDAITKLKISFNQYSLARILKYVYEKYPEMITESLIKEKFLEKSW